MRPVLAVMAAFLLFSAFVVAQPSETPGPSDGEEDGDGGPPGFVSDLVFNKVPGFLSDLFSSLPIPDFVKGFFGAGDSGSNNQSD